MAEGRTLANIFSRYVPGSSAAQKIFDNSFSTAKHIIHTCSLHEREFVIMVKLCEVVLPALSCQL